MAGRGETCPPEYNEQIVEVVRAGRSQGSLAREFEPAEQPIPKRGNVGGLGRWVPEPTG